MPAGSLLERAGFKSTGWAVCDVIAGGGYLDNEFLEFTGDLVNVAAAAGDEALFDVAELVEYGMRYALSTPKNDHGYVAPGIQREGVMTGYWLSTPPRPSSPQDHLRRLHHRCAYPVTPAQATVSFMAMPQPLFGPLL